MSNTCSLVTFVMTLVIAVNGCGRTEATAQTQPASADAPRATLPKELTLDLGNGVAMKLVLIPAGDFIMGSPETEKGHHFGDIQHLVTISKPFYMGIYTVTVDQYARFMKDAGHGHQSPGFPQTGDHPVVNISWDDAQGFCKWLSWKVGKTVTLPSIQQWEYACRAGSTTAFYFGDDEAKLGEYAWFSANAGNSTHPVGQRKPNAWGLYDMHGNVWQWCLDTAAYGSQSPNDRDPTGLRLGDFHMLRGGAAGASAESCRSASGTRDVHDFRMPDYGFRVVVLP